MADRTLILGPPGTGKTTTLMGIISGLLDDGYLSEQIGFVSYSKASVSEARDRVVEKTGIDERRWPWFRTLHSCYSKIQRFPKDAYLSGDDLKLISRYAVTERDESEEDGYEVPSRYKQDEVKRDDEIRSAMDWCRSRMVPMHHGIDRLTYATGERYTDFVRDYNWLLKHVGKFDHTSILEAALHNRITIPVRVLIVDEAQDLSPLQAACVELTFPACDRVYVAGDDDQAIYEFQGSSPDWLIDLSRRKDWTTKVLGKSWRCPEPVRQRAEKIARRMSNRADKPYAARDGDGTYRTGVGHRDAMRAIVQAGGSVMVLCRSKKYCGWWGGALRSSSVPYVIERGGSSPFGPNGLRGVIDTMSAIYSGDPIEIERLRWLANSPWAPSATKTRAGLFDRGGKARIKSVAAADSKRMVDPHEPEDIADFGLSHLVSVDPWQLLSSITAWPEKAGDVRRDLATLRRVWEANGRSWPESMPVVTTWHASKGREADLVVIDPSLPSPAARALGSASQCDPEHRVAYVALTRTRNTALVVEPDPEARGAYPFPA